MSNSTSTSTSTSASAFELLEIIQKYSKDGKLNNVPPEMLISALQNHSKRVVSQKQLKKKKPKKGPKRPTSAYLIWLSDTRKQIKNDFFGDYQDISDEYWDCLDSKKEYYSEKGLDEPLMEGKPKIIALVTSKAGKIWKTMSEEEKEPYNLKFLEAQKRYNEEKVAFVSNQSDEDPLEFVDDIPDTPEGFDGPFRMKFIQKPIKDDDGKTIKLFKTFKEAYDKAIILGNECFGITKTKRGYSVRIGDMVDTPIDKPSKGLMSWTKKDFIHKPKSKRGRPAGKTNKKKKSNFIEGSSDDESYVIDIQNTAIVEEQPDELEVEEIEYDGTKYVVSNTGDVYDPDSAEIVGKYVNQIIEFN